MIVCVFGELPDIFRVVTADIHIEKDQVAVHILLAQNVFQILLRWDHALGRLGLRSQESMAKLKTETPAVTKPIRHLGPKQPAICGDVNPKAFFAA